jgi:pSer/pThr/pTyr-binding forkhead associated (FHA) protein
LIELGSNQFEVESINLYTGSAEVTTKHNNIQVNLIIVEGPNQNNRHKVLLSVSKNTINVGRKPTADINFPDDHHLSNLHAKVCLIDGKIYLEDMGSTNGYISK